MAQGGHPGHGWEKRGVKSFKLTRKIKEKYHVKTKDLTPFFMALAFMIRRIG
jgi:hypothetical protein